MECLHNNLIKNSNSAVEQPLHAQPHTIWTVKDVVLNILKFVQFLDLKNCKLVNKSFNIIIKNNYYAILSRKIDPIMRDREMYENSMVVGNLPIGQKLDYLDNKTTCDKQHTVFYFQRFDDRIEPFTHIKTYLDELKKNHCCTNLIFIAYSKMADPIYYDTLKKEVTENGFYFLELRLKDRLFTKFNDKINLFLKECFWCSLNYAPQLQQVLDQTKKTAFVSEDCENLSPKNYLKFIKE